MAIYISFTQTKSFSLPEKAQTELVWSWYKIFANIVRCLEAVATNGPNPSTLPAALIFYSYFTCFNCHTQNMVLSFAVQELCLNIIPTFANLIDYPSMKNSLVPRIKSACLQTSSLAVSRNSHPLGAGRTAQLFLVCAQMCHFLFAAGKSELSGVPGEDLGVSGQVVCPG